MIVNLICACNLFIVQRYKRAERISRELQDALTNMRGRLELYDWLVILAICALYSLCSVYIESFAAFKNDVSPMPQYAQFRRVCTCDLR